MKIYHKVSLTKASGEIRGVAIIQGVAISTTSPISCPSPRLGVSGLELPKARAGGSAEGSRFDSLVA